MAQLPTVLVSQVHTHPPARTRDGVTLDGLEAWIANLVEAGARSPAVPSLLRGELLVGDIERPVLLTLGDSRLPTIARWAGALAQASYASLLGYSSAQIDAPGRPQRADMPLLTGHGIVLASRGHTGRPLVGLSLPELRRELADSRRALSALAGYQVRILMPAATTLGSAVDGLVLEEAHRAGYRLVLRPGRKISDLSKADPLAPADATCVQYRTLRTDDDPKHLCDWVVGSGLARQVGQVRELVNRPRRILSHFGLD